MPGSLQEKNNYYYVVLNVYENGKRKPKWINTHLPVKGNKRNAERILREQIAIYESRSGIRNTDILFSDYVKVWLEAIRNSIQETTYEGYETLAYSHVIPYFQEHRLRLQEITTEDIQTFVNEKFRCGKKSGKGGLAPRSINLLGNIINQTLNEALKNNLIDKNPNQWVEIPSIEHREPTFYSAARMEQFLTAIQDDPLYLLIKITAFYGLRRSEVLGLRWSSINFDNNILQISHTVVKINTIVKKDKTKNTTSRRSFPLPNEIKELLLKERVRQLQNRQAFGKTYVDSPYVFVWDDGTPYRPDYVTHAFQKLLKKHHMPRIRFHDIWHSCASILLSRGYALKDVQEWLGHADIKMTANIYGHLDLERKVHIANAMVSALSNG